MSNEFDGGKTVESNWFKFDVVGSGIKGTLLSKRIQPSNDPTFADQWVGEFKKADGTVWNVGVSVNKSGTVQRLQNCAVGDIVGVLFEKEGDEPKKKGFAKAKYLKVITWGKDPNYSEMDGGEVVPEM